MQVGSVIKMETAERLPFRQEASASERLKVFSWITGLPQMPSQGDMSIILQVHLRRCCFQMIHLDNRSKCNLNTSTVAWL